MKYCRKMKRRQRARLDFIGRKRDTVRWRGNVGGRRCGTGKGKEKRGDDAN
jgi:hypothetical protein